MKRQSIDSLTDSINSYIICYNENNFLSLNLITIAIAVVILVDHKLQQNTNYMDTLEIALKLFDGTN